MKNKAKVIRMYDKPKHVPAWVFILILVVSFIGGYYILHNEYRTTDDRPIVIHSHGR
jgi:hypothetical protein